MNSSPGLIGLENKNQNCFINVIVQVFSNTRRIHSEIVFDPIIRGEKTNTDILPPVLKQLTKLLFKIWSGRHETCCPLDFKNVFMQLSNFGDQFLEQDAHETLSSLIQILHTEISVPNDTPNEDSITCPSGKSSFIYDCFYGRHSKRISCSNCSYETTTYELYDHIALAIEDKVFCYLQDLLNKNFNPETLEDYKCPNCSEINTVTATQNVIRHPPTLVLCLKRVQFKSVNGIYTTVKNNTPVIYPLEKLNHCGEDYFLYAVITHSNVDSNTHTGHYKVICRSLNGGQWYEFDDTTVTKIERSDINYPDTAYLLFYQRKDEEMLAKEEYYEADYEEADIDYDSDTLSS